MFTGYKNGILLLCVPAYITEIHCWVSVGIIQQVSTLLTQIMIDRHNTFVFVRRWFLYSSTALRILIKCWVKLCDMFTQTAASSSNRTTNFGNNLGEWISNFHLFRWVIPYTTQLLKMYMTCCFYGFQKKTTISATVHRPIQLTSVFTCLCK